MSRVRLGASPFPRRIRGGAERSVEDKPPSKLGSLALHLLSSVGLTKLTLRPQDGSIAAASNLTILNVFLVRFGPMPEKRLVQMLVMVQVST